MARYNLYLLNEDSVDAAIERITSKGYSHVKHFNNHAVNFDLYITKKGHIGEVWWAEQYSHFLPEEYRAIKNKSYSAMLLCKTSKHNYIIAMGKTYFYMNEFCDMDFGVDIAQRIGDRSKNKLKNADYFGGMRSRAITSNIGYSELDYQSGESISFLKLMPISKDKWGKSSVSFGSSVQFSGIDIDPTELGLFLKDIDTALASDALFRIPRSTRVKNPNTIQELDKVLAAHITNNNEDLVRVFDYEQFGVTFLFSEDTMWRITLGAYGAESDHLDDLTLAALKEFCDGNNISLEEQLKDIKVSVLTDGKSRFTAPLRNFLDYQNEANYYLRNGYWYQFNQDFVDELEERIGELKISNLDYEFDYADYKAWQISQGDKVKYKEYYYNIKLCEHHGYKLYDRQLDIRKNRTFEICDMYDPANKKIIITKRGEPLDLSYAIDQAGTAVKLINHNKYDVERPRKKTLKVDNVELLLIFKKRVTRVEKLTELNSFTFLTKVNDLYTSCREKGLGFSITIGYENVSL